MDFGVWGNSNNNMDQGDSQQQQQQAGNQTPLNPNQNNGASDRPNGNGSNDNGVVLMHHMEHTGVVCDICDTTVRGFRYKCMQCADFDLCHFCERKGHHAGHIMMRISFPEQAAEAIRRYINHSEEFPTPHRPTPWCGPTPGNEHEFPHGGRRRCDRTDRRSSRHHHGRGGKDSSDENPEDPPSFGPGCPYQMSKKGLKKWAKSMKKAAHHHRRSSEAYAHTASRATAGAPGADGVPIPNDNDGAAPPSSFDFTAAASQIQEFLNAWGVPIDVVELYDEFGNRGQPTPAQPAPSGATNANINSSGEPKPSQNQPPSETQAPASPGSQNLLTDQLQQLNIGSQNVSDSVSNDASRPGPSVTVPAASAPSMDLEGDAGWTLIDKIPADGLTGNVINNVTEEPEQTNNRIVTFDLPNSESALPPPLVASIASIQPEAPVILQPQPAYSPVVTPTPVTTSAPASTPTSTPVNSLPMYPVLNAMQNPQFQQMMQGMTNAVGSAIRSIPMVPMGMGGFPRPQQPAQTNTAPIPAPAPANGDSLNSIPELDAQSLTTLNQLLSMGFSNHDGWLARLVVAKKGDLEAVLNALFPGGAP